MNISQNILKKNPGSKFVPWVICLSAGLFFFYEFFQLNLFDVINNDLRGELMLSSTQISWMSSSYLWANLLFLIPAGILLDKYSTKNVILISMLSCIIGTFGFAMMHSFYVGFTFHFISGIGNAFCFLSCVVLIANWFPPHRQALVIGMVVTMAFIGGMMAHTPLAFLNQKMGWRNALIIDGVVGVVLWLWIYISVMDHPKLRKDNQSESHNPQKNFAPLVCLQNWLAGLYTAFLNLPIMVLCALWGATYLTLVHHMTEWQASNIISMILLGSIFGCPIAGWLSDTMRKRKPVMIFGAIASLLCTIPLFYHNIFDLNYASLSVIFFALGFFTSTQVVSYPLVAESNSPQNTGFATSIASIIIMGSAAVAQVIFGWLIDYHSKQNIIVNQVADIQYAMLLFPITIFLSLIASMLIKETNCKMSVIK